MDDTADIKKEIDLFLQSFEAKDSGEKERASCIINYIVRQLNIESLKGRLEWHQYRTLVIEAVKGLFKLIYVDFFNYTPSSDRLQQLVHADVVFASSNNFMQMLFTRVFNGADRELIIKQIESQRPLLLSNAK